jgi:hypothetical protein
MRDHVVITGTGRCGTTFLVELLTRLGLETGFTVEDVLSEKTKFEEARAGLERDIRSDDCPFIVKWPSFCDHAEDIIKRDDIAIEHIFIPVRDLNAAAESRRFVHTLTFEHLSLFGKLMYLIKPWIFAGGLWRTTSKEPGRQEEMLLNQIYKLMLAVANSSLPVTFLRYPRIVKDCPYLFSKLQPILQDVPFESFHAAFNETVRPELVHSFNEADR